MSSIPIQNHSPQKKTKVYNVFFPKEKLSLPFGRAAPSQPGSEENWGLSVMCPVADLARRHIAGTAEMLPSRSEFVKLAVVVVVKLALANCCENGQSP